VWVPKQAGDHYEDIDHKNFPGQPSKEDIAQYVKSKHGDSQIVSKGPCVVR